MRKKLILGLGAVVVVVAGVVAMSAFEAHVINVTAHIENALAVSTEALDFGTVFPQEYLEKDFTITLSESFMAEDRVDDVEYVIKQKPKPIWNDGVPAGCTSGAQTVEEARAYCHGNPENLDCCYLSLCPFLSKTDGDPEDQNDTSHISYFVDPTPEAPNSGDEFCEDPCGDAIGRLAKSEQDTSDIWIVDLKVPPFAGYVAQDWPESCPVLEGVTVNEEGTDLGCDLWIEVTEISETSYECEKWDCLEGIEKDFFVTGRYGDNIPDAGAWELAIWEYDGGETVVAQDNYGWTNGQGVSFSLSYNPSDGAVVYTVGGKTLNWTYHTCKAFEYIIPFAKGKDANNHAQLYDMTLNGNPIPDIDSGTTYWGLKMPLSDVEQVNGFTIAGTAKLNWDGNAQNEIPGFQIFVMQTHDNLEACPF